MPNRLSYKTKKVHETQWSVLQSLGSYRLTNSNVALMFCFPYGSSFWKIRGSSYILKYKQQISQMLVFIASSSTQAPKIGLKFQCLYFEKYSWVILTPNCSKEPYLVNGHLEPQQESWPLHLSVEGYNWNWCTYCLKPLSGLKGIYACLECRQLSSILAKSQISQSVELSFSQTITSPLNIHLILAKRPRIDSKNLKPFNAF